MSAELVKDMSEQEILELIGREANLLGLSGDEAIDRVRKGQTGANYMWRDIESLVYLLAA
jgi:hypothetical protein